MNTVASFIVGCLLFISLFCTSTNGVSYGTIYPVTIYNNTNYSVNKSQVMRIGVSNGFVGGFYQTFLMLRMGVDLVNNDSSILQDIRVEINTNSSNSRALASVQSLIDNFNIHAFIGGGSLSEAKVDQLVCGISDIPHIAPAQSAELTNRQAYPMLARIQPNDIIQARAIASFVKTRGWKQIFVTYCDEDTGIAGLQQLTVAMGYHNISVFSAQGHTGAKNHSSYIKSIGSIVDKNRLRIFVHFVPFSDAPTFFPQLTSAGFMGPGKYVHIFPNDLALYISIFGSTYSWVQGGFVGIIPRFAHGPKYLEYLARFNTYSDQVGWTSANLRTQWYTFDSMMALIYAMDSLTRDGTPISEIEGPTLFEALKGMSFQGATGNVTLDDNYERAGDMNWYNFGTNYSQSFSVPIGYFSALDNLTHINTTIYYNQGEKTVVDGVCECVYGTCDSEGICHCNPGFYGLACNGQKSSSFGTKGVALVIAIPAVVVILTALAAIKYTRYKRSIAIKEVANRQRSAIKRSDITFNQTIGRGASGVVFRAMFRGTEVAVKRLLTENVSKGIVEEFEFESAIMAGLRHPNIVLFMGSCLCLEDKEMLLIMEFMEKGSLHDILHNPKAHVSYEMVLHIAYQAAKGVNFLHQASPPIIHSDLKNNKFNAKIADFGITKFKDLTGKKHKGASIGTIFWTAPEVFGGDLNSEKSDCYSFGIVLWELIHRQEPYPGKEPMMIAMDVSQKGLRPAVTARMPPDYEELMKACWDQDPNKRPSFEEIMQRLRQMSLEHPLTNLATNTSSMEAPSGMVYFVQTEINGGNTLWDQLPNEMLSAMTIHNDLLRSTSDTYDGYEVEADGDSFLFAFKDLASAINYCCSAQTSLMHLAWPNDIASNPMASRVCGHDGNLLWNGLRVHMAVHAGVSNSYVDTVSGRMKYLGPVVEYVKKLCFSSPATVSIVASNTVIEQLNTKKPRLTEEIVRKTCGQVYDIAKTSMENTHDILPKSLEDRYSYASNDVGSTMALPYTVVDVEEETPGTRSTQRERLRWIVKFEELTIHQSVGKGAIGDYYRASWNGKEVAIKALINQKLEEADILHLKAKVSILSKIKHKNLLEVFGVCFEPGHISLLLEYMPNAGLRSILSNDSISITWKTKLKIAKQIADGLAYLSKLEDPEISILTNLNSNNVLVNLHSNEVKLCDFGQGSLKDLARTMTSVGAVAWTAPEILSGDVRTQATPVYSFGIIMYEILTRRVPHGNEHPIRLVSKVLSGHRPAIPTDCPTAYKELMEQCWSANPESRPSWSTIANTLDSFQISAK